MDPSSSAMDLLYPRNLKNILNWRKSEYLLVMYDAEKEQKNFLLAVSTHATKKIIGSASFLFLTGTAILFLCHYRNSSPELFGSWVVVVSRNSNRIN
jgi:hypothetical protein